MIKKTILILIVSCIFALIVYKEFLSDKKNSGSKPNAWDIALIEGNKALDKFNLQEARKHYLESLSAAESIWGKESQQVGASYNKLGTVALEEQNLDEAEKNFRQAWLITDRLLKDSDHKKGYVLGNYARILRKLHRLEEAQELEEKAASLIELTEPAIWRDRAGVKLGLIYIYSAQGKVDQIEKLTDAAIEDFKKELSTSLERKFDRRLRAEAVTNFVYDLCRLGRARTAIEFGKSATELNKLEFGPDSVQYSESLKALADAFRDAGSAINAANYYKQALSVLNVEKEAGILKGQLFVRLAWLEHDRHHLLEAVKYAQSAQSEISAALGSEHPENCYTHRILAGFLLESGDYKAAAEHAQAALGLALKEQANDKTDLVGALKVFVFTRLINKNVDDVMPLLYKVAEKAYRKPGTLNLFSRIDLLSALSDLSRMLGKFEDAQSFIEQAQEIVPADSVWFIDIYLYTAKNLRDLGQVDNAILTAKQGLKKAIDLSPKSGKHLWALRVLANTYRIAKQYEQGIAVYKQAIELINSTPWLVMDKSNKLNIYKELGDLYLDKQNDQETFYDILKIYRALYLKNPVHSLAVYLPRLAKLAQLSKHFNDSNLNVELSKEMEQYKLLLQKLVEFQDQVASAIEEEIQRQRKENMQTAQKPILLQS